MFNDHFTKRGIAKFTTRQIVAITASSASRAAHCAITDDEDADTQNEFVSLGHTVLGMCVAAKLRTRTDGAIDRVADWHVNRKAEKAETIESPSEQ